MKFKLIGENDLEIFGVEDKPYKSHSGEIANAVILAINKTTQKVRFAGKEDIRDITLFNEPYDFVYKDFDLDFKYNRHFVEIPNKEA